MRPGTSRLVLHLLYALGSADCSRPWGPPAPLRIVVHSDPVSLDPHMQNEVLSFAILVNLFETLTTSDPDMRVKPGLAARWENPDELTWWFRLRPGARFHDGRNVQAEDVVFSVERARTHPRSRMASYLVAVEKVRALDPLTVEIVTRAPFAALLNKLAFVYIVPRGAPDEIVSPVGSGPYRFVPFVRGRAVRLEPVDPSGQALEFVPVGDANERTQRLLRGEADLVLDLPPSQVRRVRETPGLKVLTHTSSITEYLHLAVWDPRFADRRVRQAIHLALDRKRLVDVMLSGYGEPASQIVGPGIFGFNPELQAPARDLARARRLLAEAGYPDGFRVTLEYRVGRRGEEIARQLSELGLEVDLVSSPWPELYPRLSRQQIVFYYGGLAAMSADASDILDSSVHSLDEARGYGSTNQTGYADPRLDALIEEIGAVPKVEERRSLLQRTMRLLTEDLLIPLFTATDIYGAREELIWEPRQDKMLMGREMRRARWTLGRRRADAPDRQGRRTLDPPQACLEFQLDTRV